MPGPLSSPCSGAHWWRLCVSVFSIFFFFCVFSLKNEIYFLHIYISLSLRLQKRLSCSEKEWMLNVQGEGSEWLYQVPDYNRLYEKIIHFRGVPGMHWLVPTKSGPKKNNEWTIDRVMHTVYSWGETSLSGPIPLMQGKFLKTVTLAGMTRCQKTQAYAEMQTGHSAHDLHLQSYNDRHRADLHITARQRECV